MKNQQQLPTRQPKAGNLTRQMSLNTTCARGKRKHPSNRVTAYSYLWLFTLCFSIIKTLTPSLLTTYYPYRPFPWKLVTPLFPNWTSLPFPSFHFTPLLSLHFTLLHFATLHIRLWLPLGSRILSLLSSEHPGRLWCPPRLMFNGWRVIFLLELWRYPLTSMWYRCQEWRKV